MAAHWDGLAAADFFTVGVLTLSGLVRYVVFFVMKLKTRRVEIAGSTSHPDEAWMTLLLALYSGGTAPISLANPSPSRSTQVSMNLPFSMRCQLIPVRLNELPVGAIPRTSPS